MNIHGTAYRTIWIDDQQRLQVIDQRVLPHCFTILHLPHFESVCEAIRNMTVRGAGLIGAAAGYGMWLAAQEFSGDTVDAFLAHMREAGERLCATRPTAVNLAAAVQRQLEGLTGIAGVTEGRAKTRQVADAIADEDAEFCRRIGQHGLTLVRALHTANPHRPVQILTHCNAGWLAFVDYGSALAPVYAAHNAGIPVHVWVDETRPRNQGASLTAFELACHGVPHSVIADNAGGHLMRRGMVDMVITGADRVTRGGDAANKIGTYLKALAARDNDIPFYVALPSSTFDFALAHGDDIPIEERHGDEVSFVQGCLPDGTVASVRVCPMESPARNWAFDVTPARLISGLITERGVCAATESGILQLYPEQKTAADGVILFRADHRSEALSDVDDVLLEELDTQRTRLHDAGLVGVLPDGVGYGNVSARLVRNSFVITGSGTGAARVLGGKGYAVVKSVHAAENRVVSQGLACPSSESMTHGAVYAAKPAVGCVMHAHHHYLFQKLLVQGAARTPADATYGTPAMAEAVSHLLETLPDCGLFVTPGHPDGIFAFGPDAETTAEVLLQALEAHHVLKTLHAFGACADKNV